MTTPKCIACNEKPQYANKLCVVCWPLYDLHANHDDGTVISSMQWAANRARLFERRRWRKRGGR